MSAKARGVNYGLILLLLLAAKGIVAMEGTGMTHFRRTRLDSIPPRIGPWQRHGPPHKLDKQSLEMLTPDSYLWQGYRRSDGLPVDFLIIYGHRKNTFHSPGYCLPGSGWEVAEKRTTTLLLPGGRPAPMNLFVVQKGRQRQLVLYCFVSRSLITPSLMRHNFALLQNRITRREAGGALVRFILPVGTTRQKTESAGCDFARRMLPRVLGEISTESVVPTQGAS